MKKMALQNRYYSSIALYIVLFQIILFSTYSFFFNITLSTNCVLFPDTLQLLIFKSNLSCETVNLLN